MGQQALNLAALLNPGGLAKPHQTRAPRRPG